MSRTVLDTLAPVRLRLKMRPAPGRAAFRDVTLVKGPAGWGESSPLPGYPCDEAACELAAYEAATIGFPEAVRDAVRVNALVPALSPRLAAGLAREAVEAGYGCVKVKIGSGDDVSRVAAVRDAVGEKVALRVDANGCFDLDRALEVIGRLRAYHLELVEQPVESLAELAALRRRVDVPLAADEAVRNLDDAKELARLEAADALVLKQQPLGGVRTCLRLAEAAGVAVIVTSMFESSVGISAGLALAACLPELPYACGLATASALEDDVVREPLEPVAGVLHLRRIEPDPGLLTAHLAP